MWARGYFCCSTGAKRINSILAVLAPWREHSYSHPARERHSHAGSGFGFSATRFWIHTPALHPDAASRTRSNASLCIKPVDPQRNLQALRFFRLPITGPYAIRRGARGWLRGLKLGPAARNFLWIAKLRRLWERFDLSVNAQCVEALPSISECAALQNKENSKPSGLSRGTLRACLSALCAAPARGRRKQVECSKTEATLNHRN